MRWTCLFFLGIALCCFCAPAYGADAPPRATPAVDGYPPEIGAEWELFKKNFMTADGRIIDMQNQQISHSEGQGYAMLLAQAFGDRTAFAKALEWSNNNLGQGLRAWRWGATPEKKWGILDWNNASDGDILHAWALLLAGKKWNHAPYTQAGKDILGLIRQKLVSSSILLPGIQGFVTDKGVTINLSYYVFQALRDFAEYDPDNAAQWQALYNNGLNMVQNSAYLDLGIVPDWQVVNFDGKLKPEATEKPVFGYDAIRVPLYLAMTDAQKQLRQFHPYIALIATKQWMPDSVALDTGEWSKTEGGAGHYAVMAKAASVLKLEKESAQLWALANKQLTLQRNNYYATTLYLLARVF